MSLVSKLVEAERRNPERISIAELDEREAKKVADMTGRYITLGNGERSYDQGFISGYMKLIEN